MPKPYFNPNRIILLTLPEEEQLKRLSTQTDNKWDRKKEFWKSKGGEFQRKLNAAYLKVAKEYNIEPIDASGTIEEVFNSIISKL